MPETPVNCTYSAPENSIKVEGEFCWSDDQCGGNSCVNNICVGFNDGTICTSPAQCKIGSSCIGGFCNKQRRPEFDSYSSAFIDSGCSNDFDCVNTHGCNFNNCTQYFSQSDGRDVSSSIFCQSGTTYTNKWGDHLCTDTKLLNNSNFECGFNSTHDSFCTYEYVGYNSTFTKPCMCSYGIADRMFCPADTLSPRFAKAIAAKNLQMLNFF